MPERKTILLSSGGTGGHLFPAEALARELLRRGHRVVVVTDKRGHAFGGLGPDVPVHRVCAATASRHPLRMAQAVFLLLAGVVQSFCLLSRHAPDAVVGFGGYPSLPAALAAALRGTVLVVHEQNAVLGRANALLAGRADAVALSLPGTAGLPEGVYAVVTGNPVRPDIAALRDVPYAPPAGDLRLLVTGGSQGASVFARVVPDAIRLLPEEERRKISVMHQARAEDMEAVRAAYAEMGVRAEVAPFFTDMAQKLAACHLFVGRAGASTVAEVAAAGRPGVFVPYPGHADMQQKHNAAAVERAGGGFIVMQEDFTPPALARRLGDFLAEPALLAVMAEKAHGCGRGDAAKRLADLVENELEE